MAAQRSITYADAGVSFGEADRATARIKRLAQATFTPDVLTGIGSFGAAYNLHGAKLKRPVLISSADGVGTKLMVAAAVGKHDTVGQDLVNHCVNDIAVQGARPLFFLDYFATGKLDARVTAAVVKGLSKACAENHCALIGGETAEMPGLYQPGDYDLAGFIVGAAERKDLLDGSRVRKGDVLIGLPSTGLHTNGYSLARKLCFEVARYKPDTVVPALRRSIGKELLRVHRSYLKPIRALMDHGLLHAAAHITGGGITDNTPRALTAGLAAEIKLGSWPVLPVFKLLEKLGRMERDEMLRTFNMGIGMVLITSAKHRDAAMRVLRGLREKPYLIGEVVAGKREVLYR